jgi:hypothetical protein
MTSMTFKTFKTCMLPKPTRLQDYKTSGLQNFKDLKDPNQPSNLQSFKNLTPHIDSMNFKASPLAHK